MTHLLDGKSYQIYLQPAKPLLEADVLLLIRTPLVRLTRTYPRSERATRTDGPALPISFFSRYLRLTSRGPLGGLSTSSSGTQTPCGLGKITSYGGALIIEVKRALLS